MKSISYAIPVLVALALQSPAFAVEQPRIVPRVREVSRPVGDVYSTLKKYFSDSSLSHFQLVSSDPKTHTLVAKQSGIPTNTWTDWAFCKAAPMQMIFQYQDGVVTVTVKLDQTSKRSTFVHVTADFQGTYSLGSKQDTIACVSKGGLEDSILAAAGPAATSK
ncbi:MAG TPA: hypothetical protein VEU51_13235 [Candidatus Acidoferrales bacterium]|nr:hypothetical protein [Candidatus Acidoferrales bacterium]